MGFVSSEICGPFFVCLVVKGKSLKSTEERICNINPLKTKNHTSNISKIWYTNHDISNITGWLPLKCTIFYQLIKDTAYPYKCGLTIPGYKLAPWMFGILLWTFHSQVRNIASSAGLPCKSQWSITAHWWEVRKSYSLLEI